MRIDRRPLAVAFLLAFAATGCASSAGLEAGAPGTPSRTTASTDGEDLSDLEAAYPSSSA